MRLREMNLAPRQVSGECWSCPASSKEHLAHPAPRQVTQNGGASWIFETPNNLMVGGTNAVTGLANPTFVETMANVPSNY